MKKNLGFTLVELLGVILILSVVSLLSFYSVNKMLNTSQDQEYERFLNDLYIVAENYVELNRDSYPQLDYAGGKAFIKVEEFVNSNFMRRISENPKTNKIEEDATIIATTNNNYVIEYEYIDYDLSTNGYYTDGLLLHYDGFTKPVDNKWLNLSYSDNAAVVDESLYTWNIDHLSSNTTAKAILTSKNIILTNQMTFSMLFEIRSGSSAHPLFSYRTAQNGNLMIFYYQGTNITVDTGNRTNVYTGIVNNKKYKLDVVIDNNNIKTYMNGTLVNQAIGSRLLSEMPSNLKLSMFGETTHQGGSNYYVDGNLYNVKVYSRILNNEEIINNYELDKKRFGIEE